MKIVCAFDSFKGCLTSEEAGNAAKDGILSLYPDAQVTTVVCADGGEGMTQAVEKLGIGRKITIKTENPLGVIIDAEYLWDEQTVSAYIDLAAASGLPLLDEEQRSPEHTSTRGTGIMIDDAINRGAKKIYLGLGGSATNDAGLGALQVLGAQFFDYEGKVITQPISGKKLDSIAHIDISNLRKRLLGCTINLLCDVTNPFIGPNGAVAIYSAQKGADTAMQQRLENGMQALAKVIKKLGFTDISSLSGAGAAGGTAGGFMALANAKIMAGADALLSISGFDRIIADADMVLTGEGCSDAQTLSGKLPYTVLLHCIKQGIPCILLSGKIREKEQLLSAGFKAVISINTPMKSDKDPIFNPSLNPLEPSVASARLSATAARTIVKE